MARRKTGEPDTGKPATQRRTAATRARPPRSAASARAKSAARAHAQPSTEEQIRERAYYLYLKRGGGAGNALGDWLRAERELRGTAAVDRA